jgi:uncharacterized protein (DUF433 family)
MWELSAVGCQLSVVVISVRLRALARQAKRRRRRMYDNGGMEKVINWRDYIVSTPGVVGGKPRVVDTRLSVEFLLGLFGAGWSYDDAIEEYELTPEQIQAVFAYAADVLKEGIFYPIPASSP